MSKDCKKWGGVRMKGWAGKKNGISIKKLTCKRTGMEPLSKTQARTRKNRGGNKWGPSCLMRGGVNAYKMARVWK